MEEIVPRPVGRGRIQSLFLEDGGVVVHDHVVPGEGEQVLLAIDLEHFAQGDVDVVVEDVIGGLICGEEVVQHLEDVLGSEEPEPFDGDHDDVDLFAAGDASQHCIGVAVPSAFAPAVCVYLHGDVGEPFKGPFQGIVEGVDGHAGGGDDSDRLHGGGGVAAGVRGGCGDCTGSQRGAGCANTCKPQHVTAAHVLME